MIQNEWLDLRENEKEKLHGSEKSANYPINILFWQVEKWENHYSLGILGLYKQKDYPLFQSTRLFPFYNYLKSKKDNREKFRFLNYNYKKEFSKTDRNIFPFVFWGKDVENHSGFNSILPIGKNCGDFFLE